MFPFVRIQEGLPVLTPPPVANLFFDVDITKVGVIRIEKRVNSTNEFFSMTGIWYKLQNNTGQDLEKFECRLAFSFNAEGEVVKMVEVKEKIDKWAADSWTKELRSPFVDIPFPAGWVLTKNVKNKGTVEFIIDGEFEHYIPMWFSKTKNMKGNGAMKFK